MRSRDGWVGILTSTTLPICMFTHRKMCAWLYCPHLYTSCILGWLYSNINKVSLLIKKKKIYSHIERETLMILLKGVDLDCIGSDGSANEEKLTKRSWKDMVMVYCFGYSSLLGGWNTRERFSVSTNNMFWKTYATYYILSINLQKRKRKKRCRLQISILLVNNLGIHYFPLHSSSRAFFLKIIKT